MVRLLLVSVLIDAKLVQLFYKREILVRALYCDWSCGAFFSGSSKDGLGEGQFLCKILFPCIHRGAASRNCIIFWKLHLLQSSAGQATRFCGCHGRRVWQLSLTQLTPVYTCLAYPCINSFVEVLWYILKTCMWGWISRLSLSVIRSTESLPASLGNRKQNRRKHQWVTESGSTDMHKRVWGAHLCGHVLPFILAFECKQSGFFQLYSEKVSCLRKQVCSCESNWRFLQ